MRCAVAAVRFLKNRDEHRRNVLQEIFGFGTVENFSVLLQLVRDLINDKPTASCECVMGLLEQSPLLVDLQNAKRDAGNDIVARVDGASTQFQRQVRSVVVDQDRKSTRLNSSHVAISYAVFCLKKKKKQ